MTTANEQAKEAEERELERIAKQRAMGSEMQPVGLDEVNTSTRLLDKNFSPLIVRKYQMHGWPMFVTLICDISLSNLDKLVHEFTSSYGPKVDDIQWVRNYCGALSEYLINSYEEVKPGCVEGVGVLWYVDKMFCSSLYGDFMTHHSCKMELYQIINTLPHI